MNVTMHLPPLKITGLMACLSRTDTGPVDEVRMPGAGPDAPFLVFRCLEDYDEWIGFLVSRRAAFGEALARHEARPLVDHRPASMLQPVTFDDSTAGDELRTVALQPVDETADSWEPLPDLPHREPGEALDELTALRAGYAAGHARAREALYAAQDESLVDPGAAVDLGLGAAFDRDQPDLAPRTVYPELSPEALAGEKPLESLAAEPDAAE